MPQKRYWNFKDDDATTSLIRWLTGMLSPGLYHGFDFNPTANMNLNLVHTATGFKDVDSTVTESNFQSLLITRQGTVVKEDAAITINGVANGHATLPRIDTVVITHQYVATSGGSTALYSIITGTPNASPTAPALTNALTQIKLGELYIPALTTALNGVGVVYTRATAPFFAGIDPSSFINGLINIIVGNRIYSEHNILVDSETVTSSFDRLDKSFGYRDGAADLNSVIQPGIYHISRSNTHAPGGINYDGSASKGAILTVTKDISTGPVTTIRQHIKDLWHSAEWYRQSVDGGTTWTGGALLSGNWLCTKYAEVLITKTGNDFDATGSFNVSMTTSNALFDNTCGDKFNDVKSAIATVLNSPVFSTPKFQVGGDNYGSVKWDGTNFIVTRKTGGDLDIAGLANATIELLVTYQPT